jgi:hypothetical protein
MSSRARRGRATSQVEDQMPKRIHTPPRKALGSFNLALTSHGDKDLSGIASYRALLEVASRELKHIETPNSAESKGSRSGNRR